MERDPDTLIRAAFDMARRSGKPDWRRMTTAVLKNRILQLTGGNFDQSQYGARTFQEFVALAAATVTIDRRSFPPVVELVALDEAAPAESESSERRVRGDFWNAIMDYSSGRVYVWDQERVLAREAQADDDLSNRLPTVNADDVASWRADFTAEWEPRLDDEARVKLLTWNVKGLPSRFLPPPALPEWNRELKRRVEQRVRQWFHQKSLPAPVDLVEARRHRVAPVGSETENLRQVVIECIQRMTERELMDLKLPVSALRRLPSH